MPDDSFLFLNAGLIQLGVAEQNAPLVALCLLFTAVTSIVVVIIIFFLLRRLHRPPQPREGEPSGDD